MRHLMWILTWIAVGIGGVLGAASVIMLSASHQSGAQSPSVVVRPSEPPAMATKQKTGEPSRSLILTSHRQRTASE
ncbi:hypothetical protein BH10PSE6_BH10PSE6_38140 [soil metagenome]